MYTLTVGVYLLKVNNENMKTMCDLLKDIDVVLSLLSTLNRYHMLF